MGPTDAGMRAWRAFLEAHAAISKTMERELREECEFALSWYDALVQLHEAGGSMRMHELAAHLLLSRSATTRFADRLERAGLIERRSATSDRRGTVVLLTAEGKGELKRTAPVHMRGIVDHFVDHFDDEELATIEKLFNRLAPERG
jgi:DNA-binding MarR family transcriptional regulator